jgi:predicted nuclease with RNAse H fold
VARWLGVDVGVRKGLDIAVVDERQLILLASGQGVADVVRAAGTHRPAVVAVDGPRSCAPRGEHARACELALNRAVCGIRWTPDEDTVNAGAYYRWIVCGRAVYEALERGGVDAIEVFPTASWTRWHGPRDGRSRASWSTAALAALGVEGVPTRTNQDQRDAIAAAVTAREHTHGRSELFGEIVVPAARLRPTPIE